MRSLSNPKWILLINTFPTALMFLFFGSVFKIINSELDSESLQTWKLFAITLGVLGGLNLTSCFLLIFKQKSTPIYIPIINIVLYIAYFILYSNHYSSIAPWSIPNWMMPENLYIAAGTFIMPTIFYSLIVIVVHFTPNHSSNEILKNFILSIIFPALSIIILKVSDEITREKNINLSDEFFFFFLITGSFLFVFFLIRFFYILAINKSAAWYNEAFSWKLLIALILPILGLFINNGVFFNKFSFDETDGVFGNFNSIWYYILAIVNGLLICIPSIENKKIRLVIFVGRSITYVYTFYFFLIFLPYLPLSIIAIIAFGLGFLMLVPLPLFIIHTIELYKDFNFLKSFYPKNRLNAVLVGGFLLIPIFLTIGYIQDRSNLNKALTYVYQPDYSKSYHINKKSLKNTIKTIKNHKFRTEEMILGGKSPYLTSYYNWIVFDNLTISDEKVETLEKIFFGRKEEVEIFVEAQNEPEIINPVKISKITSNSSFDSTRNAWKSWVELEITNYSELNLSEYSTIFNLPEGAWISDYYLNVLGSKEMGMLSEKKAAMWVYANITNTNRDPGILYYLTGNKVAFRVYPFSKFETRKTGFEILHKEPILFKIDDKEVFLGKKEVQFNTSFENEHLIYVSVQEKQNLKRINRKPYIHFIVDASNGKKSSIIQNKIEKFILQYDQLTQNAKISYVNSYVKTFEFNKDWKQQLLAQIHDGGFYADRAFKSALFNSYQSKTDSFPIFVIVSDDSNSAIFDKDYSDWKFSFPENEWFYVLNKNNRLEQRSLVSKPKETIIEVDTFLTTPSVLEYPLKNNEIAYLRDNNEASIILKKEEFDVDTTDLKSKSWSSGLLLQGLWTSQILHPDPSNKDWKELVQYSFLTKIMTPVTSYLVVETQAQKEILKKKQKEVLSSNYTYDISDDAESMSEPNFWIMFIFLAITLFIYQKRKIKRS